MKKARSKRHKFFILSACSLIFVFSIISIFTIFQHQLDEKSRIILTDGLTTNMQEQNQRTELIIYNLEEMLNLLQNTLETTETAIPADGWDWTIQNLDVEIDYLSTQQILNLTAPPELQTLYQQLAAGENVVTDLGQPQFTNTPSQLALLYPVMQNGSLTGVLRAQIDVTVLLGESTHPDSFFQKIYIILTKPDGSVIYADTAYPNEGNLFTAILQGGIDPDEVKAIQQTFAENEAMTISFSGKGNQYYMSWESVGLHDWRMVMFARSPDVVFQTTTILVGMVTTGIILILLTVVFCIVLIQLLLRQKQQMETQQRRYDALAQFNDTLLFEYDIGRNSLVFAPNALERLDLDEQCLEGMPIEYYVQRLLYPDDQKLIQEKLQRLNIVLGQTYYMEIRFRCKNGAYNWFGCQFKSIENQDNAPRQLVGKLVDINDQRKREQVLQRATLQDALTGIYNRGAETLINNLLKEDERGLFFMLDLDDFKTINDTYGHAVGDALLTGIAQILKEVFRPDDIIARVGGDEFVAFLSGINDANVAEKKAALIQSRMEQLDIPGMEHAISASIGASSAPQSGSDYDALVRAADQAMYTIKQQSKKGFAFHIQNK